MKPSCPFQVVRHTLAGVFCLAAVGALSAAEPTAAKPKPTEPPVFLTIESAGPAYLLQGEFATTGHGANIIALGGDQYRLVLFAGGLPGDGWDGSPRQEMDGKADGAKVAFVPKSGEARATLAEGTLTVTRPGADALALRRIVRHSPTEGAPPPAGAKVLFGGKDADAWRNGKMDERGFLRCGTTSKDTFRDYTLHLEFLLPFKPYARGQGRANSGVYHQDRYEVQVLDSFGLAGKNNECGGIYSKTEPSVNMCFPPLLWQTYDIDFTAAKFDGEGKKTKNAVITVKHNGVTIHDKVEITGPTGGGKKEDPSGGAIQLQGHGNPVFYRNIWVVESK